MSLKVNMMYDSHSTFQLPENAQIGKGIVWSPDKEKYIVCYNSEFHKISVIFQSPKRLTLNPTSNYQI